jgi:predicted RNA-binding protein YlqC (UPF0109 family)
MPEKKPVKKTVKKAVKKPAAVQTRDWKRVAQGLAIELGWSKKDLEKEFGDGS